MTMTVPPSLLTVPSPRRSSPASVDVDDPGSHQVVRCAAGSRLTVRFPAGLRLSHWRIEQCPGHLVPIAPLSESGHEFVFVVFRTEEPGPLRLVRHRPDRGEDLEERLLHIVPLG